MNIERRTSNVEQIGKHALEIVGSVWLVIVAVQYLSRYFLGMSVDFKPAYIVMLVLTVVVAVWRGVLDRNRTETSL